MEDELIVKKLNNIENLLNELNAKVDNFLGFEELSEDELNEIDYILKDMKKGNYYTIDEVFGEE